MLDQDFALIKVKASIAPQAETWPSPDFSKVTITGDVPHVEVGDPHWSALHDAVHEARDRTLKALGAISAIDEDKTLSPTGKLEKKKEIATKAITALKKAQHLGKARSAVENQVASWNKQLGLTPKVPDAAAAVLHAEIRSHLAAMKAENRVVFINSHLGEGEVVNAVLTAPAFLSGLSPAELGVVRQRVEALAVPEIAAAKAATLTALAETEKGWRNAANQIRQAGGLEMGHDGTTAVEEMGHDGKVAQRAGTSV